MFSCTNFKRGVVHMIGAIIGDIAGSRYEFDNVKTINFELVDDKCFFTDDTVCTVAIMDFLMHAPEKNEEYAVKYLQKWTRKYPNAGYGGRFRKWIHSDNPKPYGSYGNGSAMRISPVAYCARNEDELEHLVHIVTDITHNHFEGIKGAMVTAKCIYKILHNENIKDVMKYAINEYPEIGKFEYDALRKVYRFNETCQNSVPQAIYCFFISDSFEDCLRKTIYLGGDCDTTAAINSGIAEAYYEIPKDLIERARAKLPCEMIKIIDEFSNYINK